MIKQQQEANYFLLVSATHKALISIKQDPNTNPQDLPVTTRRKFKIAYQKALQQERGIQEQNNYTKYAIRFLKFLKNVNIPEEKESIYIKLHKSKYYQYKQKLKQLSLHYENKYPQLNKLNKKFDTEQFVKYVQKSIKEQQINEEMNQIIEVFGEDQQAIINKARIEKKPFKIKMPEPILPYDLPPALTIQNFTAQLFKRQIQSEDFQKYVLSSSSESKHKLLPDKFKLFYDQITFAQKTYIIKKYSFNFNKRKFLFAHLMKNINGLIIYSQIPNVFQLTLKQFTSNKNLIRQEKKKILQLQNAIICYQYINKFFPKDLSCVQIYRNMFCRIYFYRKLIKFTIKLIKLRQMINILQSNKIISSQKEIVALNKNEQEIDLDKTIEQTEQQYHLFEVQSCYIEGKYKSLTFKFIFSMSIQSNIKRLLNKQNLKRINLYIKSQKGHFKLDQKNKQTFNQLFQRNGLVSQFFYQLPIHMIIDYNENKKQFIVNPEQLSVELIKGKVEQFSNLSHQVIQIYKVIQFEQRKIYWQSPASEFYNQTDIKNCEIIFIIVANVDYKYYGFDFAKKKEFTYDDFMTFTMDMQSQLKDLPISTFRKEEETKFNLLTINYIYYYIKRHFELNYILQKLRRLVYEKTHQSIWDHDIKQFSRFIYLYLISKSQPRLRLQLMQLTKEYMPIPIYYPRSTQINNSIQFALNQQLLWLLYPTITVVSLGSSKSQKKGKSYFIDEVFKTSFSKKLTHSLTQCPEIMLNVFQQFFNINVVDIPSNFTGPQSQLIISKADLIIYHYYSGSSEIRVEQKLRQLQEQYKRVQVIILWRDCNVQLKEIMGHKIHQNSIVKLQNLKQSKTKHVQQKVGKLICQKIRSIYDKTQYSTKFFDLFKNQVFIKFDLITNKLKKQITNTKNICFLMEKYQSVGVDQQKRYTDKILNTQLHPYLMDVFNFFISYQKDYLMLLPRFKNFIITEKMYYSSKLAKLAHLIDNLKEQQFTQVQIGKYSSLIDQLTFGSYKSKLQLGKEYQYYLKQFQTVKQIIQNKIKPKFISIQLFWRQLMYKYQSKNNQIWKNIIHLKKSNILLHQPFQILDGDLLKMPIKFIKQSFLYDQQKTAVISVLGPQSSGKSTLLNFLFGCDFSTSQGRCTRGVYGTIYRLKKPIAQVKKILILDTEGLFSVGNEHDNKNRLMFDSKLILLVMLISDILIYNTAGDIDVNSSKILGNAFQRYKHLENIQRQSGQQNRFNSLLILNQRTNIDRTSVMFDITKSRLFEQSNTFQLQQAYFTSQIGSDKISILQSYQKIVKKTARVQFLNSCQKLQKSIVKNLEKKSKYFSLYRRLLSIQQNWQLINNYTNLGMNKNQQQIRLKHQIMNWIQKQVEKYYNEVTKILKDNDLNNQYCLRQQMNLRNYLIKQYQIKNSPSEAENQYIRNIKAQCYQILKNRLMSKKKQLEKKIKSNQLLVQIKKININGDIQLNDKIFLLNKMQMEKKIKLSQQQKQKIFEQFYNNRLKILQDQITSSLNQSKLLEQIEGLYQSAFNQVLVFNQGLPKKRFNQKYLKIQNDDQFKRALIDQINIQHLQLQKTLTYSDIPPTIKLEGGKSSSTGQFFEMKYYFQKKKILEYYNLTSENLNHQLQKQKIENHFYSNIKNIIKKHELYMPYYESISNYLYRLTRKYILNQAIFQQLLEKKLFNQRIHTKNYKLIRQNTQLIKFKLDQRYLLIQKNIQSILKTYYKNQNYSFNNQNYQVIRAIKWLQIFQKIMENNRLLVEKQILRPIVELVQQQILQFTNHNHQFRINCKGLISDASIKPITQSKFKIFTKKELIYKNFSKLYYFNGISLYDRITTNKEPRDICIGCMQRQVYQVKQQFKRHQYLQSYLNQDKKILQNALKGTQLKQFLFQQLKSKKKIQKLFNLIWNHISKKQSISFGPAFVEQIFMFVKNKIQIFDYDLQQLSYVLNTWIKGYFHLFAVYTIWKKIVGKQIKKINEPIQKFKSIKSSLKTDFMERLNQDSQSKHQLSMKKFIEQIAKIVNNQFNKNAEQIVNKQKIQFSKQYNRQTIQQKVDQIYFSQTAQIDELLHYIQKPNEFLQRQYSNFIQNRIKNLRATKFDQLKNWVNNLKLEFLQTLKSLKESLDKQGLNRDKCQLNQLFINKQTVSLIDPTIYRKCGFIMFQLFKDFLANTIKQQYQKDGLKLVFNKSIYFVSKVSPQLKQILKKIDIKEQFALTNIYSAIKRLCDTFKLISNQFDKCLKFDKHQATFKNECKILFCEAKCPACYRVCGLTGVHKKHCCCFGHQIRAFGTITLPDNTASVTFCEMIKEKSTILYDGSQITWAEFKHRHQKTWEFSDLMEPLRSTNLRNTEKFKIAWNVAGKKFCQKQGMIFTPCNQISMEDQTKIITNNIHFIFALDDSGSMSGERWNDLMQAFECAIENIQQIQGSEQNIKSTVLIEGDCGIDPRNMCIVHQQNVPPKLMIKQITPRFGGTYFKGTFQTIIKILRKYLDQNKTDQFRIVFMTDGMADCPNQQLKIIKAMQIDNPQKIKYYGIQFLNQSIVMKTISDELKGQSKQAVNLVQLKSAYVEIIRKK